MFKNILTKESQIFDLEFELQLFEYFHQKSGCKIKCDFILNNEKYK